MRALIFFTILALIICSCSTHKTSISLSPEIVTNTSDTDDIAVANDGSLYGIINNNTIFTYTNNRINPFNQALGDGPGEIKHMTMMKSYGNNFYLYDKGNSRFAVYSPDYGFTEMMPVTEEVCSFTFINGMPFYTLAEGCQKNDPVIHTPDSIIDAIRFDQKDKQCVLIESGNNLIILGFDCSKPAIHIYDNEYKLIRKIKIEGRWNNTRPDPSDNNETLSPARILTDLAFYEKNSLIFTALSGEKPGLPQEIRIVHMNGTELARVTLPVKDQAGSTDVKIAPDQKKMILYVADDTHIYKVDYQMMITQKNIN